jgi:oxidoreductase
VRTVVVGLGWVAREVWLPRLRGHPGFRLVGAVEPDPAVVGRAGSLLAGVPVYPDCDEVPVADVDLALVLTPNHSHARIGAWFLRRGRAVFLEKPAATGGADLAELAGAVREGAGRLVLSAAARHRADVAALRGLVADGVLGEPRLAELGWVRSRGVPPAGWFTTRAAAGGGALVDLGWHLIDVLHHLWGPATVRGAAATMSDDFLRRQGWGMAWRGRDRSDGAGEPGPGRAPGPEPDVEDQLAAMVMTRRYGVSLRVAWASHEERDVTTIVLHGTAASARLRTTFGFSPHRVAQPSLVVSRHGEVTEVPLAVEPVGVEYDRQLDVLAAALSAGPAPAAGPALAEATAVLDVVAACYRAAGDS